MTLVLLVLSSLCGVYCVCYHFHKRSQNHGESVKGTVDLPVRYTSQRKPRVTTNGGKMCYRCSKTGHLVPNCSAKDAVCHGCGKKGHVCRRKLKPLKALPGRANVVEADSSEERPQSDESLSDDLISNLHQVSGSAPSPYRVPLHIKGKPAEMVVDTGAAVTIMPKDLWQALFPKIALAKSSVCLRTYTSQAILVDGQADVAVHYGTFTGDCGVMWSRVRVQPYSDVTG